MASVHVPEASLDGHSLSFCTRCLYNSGMPLIGSGSSTNVVFRIPIGEDVRVFLMVSSTSLMMAQPLAVAKVVLTGVASALMACEVTTSPSL